MKRGLAAIASKPLYKIRRLQLIGYIAIFGLTFETILIFYLLIKGR